jgi:membrane-associated phospholipid phosphatase
MSRLTAALGGAFLVLTLLVQTGATATFDRRLEPHVAPLADGDWNILVIVADPVVTVAIFAAGFIVLRRRGRSGAAWAWCLALAAGMAIEVLFKAVVEQIPFAAEERVLDLFSLTHTYPSGHAMRAVLLAGLGVALVPRLARLWIACAGFVAVWVVVSGMHLVTDAMGGVLLGCTLVAAVNCRWGGAGRPEVVDSSA